jgi:hypothetical protein
MGDRIIVRRRRRRSTPMRSRRIGGLAAAGAGASAAAAEFPGSAMPEPESARGRVVSGGLSVLLHGGLVAVLLLAAWLTPDDIVEDIIEITRLEDVEQVAEKEPAPAPKVIAESSGRFDPAPMALAPQVVNPAVVQRAAPVVNAERLEVDTVSPVQAPREITRAAAPVVEQARAFQSIATATAAPVAVESQAPAIRGPVEIQAPKGIQAGPRQIAATGRTAGLAAPGALGTGSSVREGIASGRDVLGAKEGVQAQVNWAVGPGGRGRGGDGLGEAGVSFEACTSRPEVQAYLSRIRTRVLSRWVLPPDVDANQSITLRFTLDPAGTANHVEFVSTPSPILGESAVKAMRSASPFDPMAGRVRCLANNPIQATFRNPSIAKN